MIQSEARSNFLSEVFMNPIASTSEQPRCAPVVAALCVNGRGIELKQPRCAPVAAALCTSKGESICMYS